MSILKLAENKSELRQSNAKGRLYIGSDVVELFIDLAKVVNYFFIHSFNEITTSKGHGDMAYGPIWSREKYNIESV
jgi:hypothetical protein